MSVQPILAKAPVVLPGGVLLHVEYPAPRLDPRRDGAPSATFRLQFRPGFGFREARALAPFLSGLGVTALYASPIFQARPGSQHGYDVCNPLRLNPELGTERDFDDLCADLRLLGMGLILDIVPNHMAACEDNPWWTDVLENGRASRYASYFDIDWTAHAGGQLVLPVLGRPYAEALDNQELRLIRDERGLAVRYWERRFPLSPDSYRDVFALRLDAWGCSLGAAHDAVRALRRLLESPPAALKAHLDSACRTHPQLAAFLDRSIEEYNGVAGDPASFELLDRLLARQHYRLVCWRAAAGAINYRRFFDINDLVALRVEDEEVFGATHALVLRLAAEGKISGVRIDHIDGLRDPARYLRRLRDCLATCRRDGFYIVAEKILSGSERLPQDWPLAGTTGYDFLNAVNGVFVDSLHLPRIENLYADFTGVRHSFQDAVYEQKKRVIEQLFPRELARLAARLESLAAGDRYACEASSRDFSLALEETTACLPVYRTYVRSFHCSSDDRAAAGLAVQLAKRRNPAASGPALDFLRRVLTLEFPDWFSTGQRDRWLEFVLAWQQFTGPVMAKGAEDTACYTHNRLVSLNVVGGSSQPVAVDQFHRFNLARAADWPHSMNTTSTHDTKRSEDVCARINVLSERPALWEAAVRRWSEWNLPAKTVLRGSPAPGPNEEILFYQVLLGAWPLDPGEVPEFMTRIQAFMLKAAREAKTRTSWLAPDAEYERALAAFVDGVFHSDRFLQDFLGVLRSIASFGAIGSLAQTLLKIASPGVPDFYQASLLWDFSLVDPDNRRPVDFARCLDAFREIRSLPLENFTRNWQDGRIKLYLIARALDFRRRNERLLAAGQYVPLAASGRASEHVVAFARRLGGRWAVAAAPRLLARLCGERDPFTSVPWAGTALGLPHGAPQSWTNVLTGETHTGLALSEIFRRFPVALLSGAAPR